MYFSMGYPNKINVKVIHTDIDLEKNGKKHICNL